MIRENPASARGTLEIMKFLHQYVPVAPDGKTFPILCHGDQLSVERMVEAKLSMAFGEDEAARLTGLVPRPQGFHKRCIILQDSMNMLFRGSTVGDRGSLFHVKNKFAFRTVKKKISDCINSVVDFFNFVTEGSVCMIVCQMLNIENIDDIAESIPDDSKQREELFINICEKVVALSWPQVDMASIHLAAGLPLDEHQNTNTAPPLDFDSGDEGDQSSDDTIIYWENDDILEETMPYYDSDNDFGVFLIITKKKPRHLCIVTYILYCYYNRN